MNVTSSLIAAASSNRQIARDLSIGEQTVKTHVRGILGKLGCKTASRQRSSPFATEPTAQHAERDRRMAVTR